ncbi:hypothetical protein BJ165DRAFT_1520378 [Panaeolus papilionaceus]|nr:hypothetical protein BJ165DRAFT_1520378 [Panaeolus papilionaceus]
MSSSSGGGPPDLVTAVVHLNAGKYFQIAAVIVLIYDHLLTFSEEFVERIWKQKLSGASILFLLNRYGNLFAFIVIVDAFNDPSWTPEVCKRFAPYEGAQSLVFIGSDIRTIRSLHPILVFLMVLWCMQISMSGVGISTGNGCILVGTNPLFPALWVAPLITDTCIFVLTLYRLRPFARKGAGKTPTIQIFIRDGVMYFLVIFAANLINCLIYFIAPEDLRALGASFSQVLTSVMISRLVLNLRSLRDDTNERQITRSIDFATMPRTTRRETGVTFRPGPGGIVAYGSGLTNGWTDDERVGADARQSEWRESRGFWGIGSTHTTSSAQASGTGTVNTFMTLAIGNLGEDFEDGKNDGCEVRGEGGAMNRAWEVADGTELRVMDAGGLEDDHGPRRYEEPSSNM